MRDGITHDTRILSGMWGGIGGKIPDIRQLTDSWGHYSAQGDNDRFASEAIFPRIKHDYICHDHTGNFDDGRPFPPHSPMKGTMHIGEVVPPERYSLDGWLRLREREEELEQARQRFSELSEENHRLREEKQQLVINLRTQEGGRSDAACIWPWRSRACCARSFLACNFGDAARRASSRSSSPDCNQWVRNVQRL
jgi:hypothetical protein